MNHRHVVYGFFFFLAFLNGQCASKVSEKKPQPNYSYRSVTFIAGEDKSANTYYGNAAIYFNMHGPKENHEVKVGVTSIQAILEHINSIESHQRWEHINIVAHGNAWSGLSVKLKPNGGRTTVQSLNDAFDKASLPVLKNHVFTDQSQVVFYACGLGDNAELMLKLKAAFSADISPKIVSTKLFNVYAVGKTRAVHSLAQYWYAYQKPKAKFDRNKLRHQLVKRYPNEAINWNVALSRKLPPTPKDAFYYTFKIPIRWTTIYDDKADIPYLETEADIHQWINNQPEFMQLLQEYGIPKEAFQWTARTTTHQEEDGSYSPALKLKGVTKVVSVLRQLVDSETGQTYVPDFSDNRYYLTL